METDRPRLRFHGNREKMLWYTCSSVLSSGISKTTLLTTNLIGFTAFKSKLSRVGGDAAHAHSVNFSSEKIPTKGVIHDTRNFLV